MPRSVAAQARPAYGLAGWLSGLASASLRFSTNSDPADLDRPSHDSRCSHLNAERASVLTGFLVGSRSSSSARWVATSRSRSAQERSPWARARRLQDRSASPSHLGMDSDRVDICCGTPDVARKSVTSTFGDTPGRQTTESWLTNVRGRSNTKDHGQRTMTIRSRWGGAFSRHERLLA
jgi:hypothetical protein